MSVDFYLVCVLILLAFFVRTSRVFEAGQVSGHSRRPSFF